MTASIASARMGKLLPDTACSRCLTCVSRSGQAALWLVWKSAKGDRNKLAVPLSVFGLHLFLGNWWNGAHSFVVGTCALEYLS